MPVLQTISYHYLTFDQLERMLVKLFGPKDFVAQVCLWCLFVGAVTGKADDPSSSMVECGKSKSLARLQWFASRCKVLLRLAIANSTKGRDL